MKYSGSVLPHFYMARQGLREEARASTVIVVFLFLYAILQTRHFGMVSLLLFFTLPCYCYKASGIAFLIPPRSGQHFQFLTTEENAKLFFEPLRHHSLFAHD